MMSINISTVNKKFKNKLFLQDLKCNIDNILSLNYHIKILNSMSVKEGESCKMKI